MKPFCVIQSEAGSVGYPKGFDSFEEAQEFFDKCEKGAAFSVRRGRYESVFKYKNLSLEQVHALMGWI